MNSEVVEEMANHLIVIAPDQDLGQGPIPLEDVLQIEETAIVIDTETETEAGTEIGTETEIETEIEIEIEIEMVVIEDEFCVFSRLFLIFAPSPKGAIYKILIHQSSSIFNHNFQCTNN
jgi:hypothetical protein